MGEGLVYKLAYVHLCHGEPTTKKHERKIIGEEKLTFHHYHLATLDHDAVWYLRNEKLICLLRNKNLRAYSSFEKVNTKLINPAKILLSR